MKFRSPWLIKIIALLAAVIIRLWMSTMRARAVSIDGSQHPIDPATKKYIYAFWHEGLLALLVTRTPARVLISKHPDGELIAQVCRCLGVGVIRGSSSRGGHWTVAEARGGTQALMELIDSARDCQHLAITPDGPRGPRRELQPGMIVVAAQTGLAIVPIGVGFCRAWRATSWDRFAIPVPFSTMVGVVGEAISVPPLLSRADIRHWQQHVQARLTELTTQAEDWAERICREGRRAQPPAGRTIAKFRKAG
jgi:lysophospholipid acyltransferase (LPLAT)-like uncharacterized protein